MNADRKTRLINIALAAIYSSPIFDPRYVNHKKEKVSNIVRIKILKLILKIFFNLFKSTISFIIKLIFVSLFK